MAQIWIEAESFWEYGGWVNDTQSIMEMGSAYLMAHGYGVPVADAVGKFSVTQGGRYYAYARTRDWTAAWGVKDPAGKFEILLDGVATGEILGTKGAEWGFQYAGTVELAPGEHTVALHDLTGFNGRCDAILLTTEAGEPGDAEKYRPNITAEHPVTYDLVVVGGGIAGICTALAASRSGVKTVLIQDRGVLGGCNSSEVRVCMGGQINHKPYEHLGDIVKEIAPVMGNPSIYKEAYFEDARKAFAFEVPSAGEKCHLMLWQSVTALEKEGDRIAAVIATDTKTGEKTRICGKLFADCSGDGILARLGGAAMMYGNDAKADFGEELAPEEHKNLVMGQSIRWYSEEEEEECPFPDLDWGLDFDEDSYLNCKSGDWEQETGFTRDMVHETEYIRDYGLRAIYANWSFQKNHCQTRERFAKSKIRWVSPLGGKREAYRVVGDYVLTQHDLEGEVPIQPDGTACVSWGIDIHYPEPINAEKFGEAFRSFAYHKNQALLCPVPYRCLYARDIPNLFIGGRLVSSSHVAFSAIRVMRTLGMLGEVAGLAAAVCVAHNCLPREVYTDHFAHLQAAMLAGPNVPAAFACGGVGDGESYHFKDIGWWHLHNGSCADNTHTPTGKPRPEDVEKFNYCVSRLGIRHRYPIPKEWK